MNCTNVFNMLNDIKEHEQKELVKALDAHGGEYRFVDEDVEVDEDDDFDAPVVTAMDWFSSARNDFYVSYVKANKNGRVTVWGFLRENGDPSYTSELDILPAGEMSRITDMIPKTPEVTDAIIPFPHYAVVVKSEKMSYVHANHKTYCEALQIAERLKIENDTVSISILPTDCDEVCSLISKVNGYCPRECSDARVILKKGADGIADVARYLGRMVDEPVDWIHFYDYRGYEKFLARYKPFVANSIRKSAIESGDRVGDVYYGETDNECWYIILEDGSYFVTCDTI